MRPGLYIPVAVGAWLFTALAGAEPYQVAATGLAPEDPVLLAGNWLAPKRPGAPVLVLLHGLGSNRGEWDSLARAAGRRGWGALAFDLRGHGASRQTATRRDVRYQDPALGKNPRFWQSMVSDLSQVMADLERSKGIPPGRLVPVGASLGANVAIAAAARRPDAPAAVLLSAGLNYAGIDPRPALAAWRRPLLLVAARPDRYAFESLGVLETAALPPARVDAWALEKGTPRGAHGTQLFDGKLEEEILDWIAAAIRPGGGAISPGGGTRP